MKKDKALQAKLRRSLDQANTKTPAPAPTPPQARTAAAPTGKCTRLTVSLFDGDLARLDAIRDYMADQGHRLSTSQAVKLALRTAPLSDDLLSALDAVKKEDGRKGW